MNARFTRDMEAAARIQLINAFAWGRNDAEGWYRLRHGFVG